MTSASELFYAGRRNRSGRSGSVFESDSVSDRISIHNIGGYRHHRHNRSGSGARRIGRLDLLGCDPPLPRSRFQIHRSSFHEHEPFTSPSSPANINRSENETNARDRFRRGLNDELPGPVLLARERLLQRLRSVSLSGSRCSNRASTSTHRRNLTRENDFRLAGVSDQVVATDSLWRDKNKRPPGLTQESLKALCVVVFNNLDYNIQEAIPQECSICLEAFLNGDKLFCLPCGHRFHDTCLVPWVRTCGDCPYCRAGISENSL